MGRRMEIDGVRGLLVVGVVVFHCFCPFGGRWRCDQVVPEVFGVDWWVCQLAYLALMEGFVFISGVLFGGRNKRTEGTKGFATVEVEGIEGSLRRPGEEQKASRLGGEVRGEGAGGLAGLGRLAGRKFWRLLVPAWVFGALYVWAFPWRIYCDVPSWEAVWAVLNGTGHLWFLPMLFCCFVLGWLLRVSRLRPSAAMCLLLVLALLPVGYLPLQLNSALWYMPFFYFGMLVGEGRVDLRGYFSWWWTGLFAAVALGVCVLSYIGWWTGGFVIPTGSRAASLFLMSVYGAVLRLVYSAAGVMALYCGVVMGLRTWRRGWGGVNALAREGMGVYVVQEFVVVWIYYVLGAVGALRVWWLPWATVGVALGVSYWGVVMVKGVWRVFREKVLRGNCVFDYFFRGET